MERRKTKECLKKLASLKVTAFVLVAFLRFEIQVERIFVPVAVLVGYGDGVRKAAVCAEGDEVFRGVFAERNGKDCVLVGGVEYAFNGNHGRVAYFDRHAGCNDALQYRSRPDGDGNDRARPVPYLCV